MRNHYVSYMVNFEQNVNDIELLFKTIELGNESIGHCMSDLWVSKFDNSALFYYTQFTMKY